MGESYSVMRLASVAEVWESCSTGQAPLSSITAVLEKQCQVRHWWAPFPVPEPFLLPSLTLAAQDSGWVGACALYSRVSIPFYNSSCASWPVWGNASAFLTLPLHSRPGVTAREVNGDWKGFFHLCIFTCVHAVCWYWKGTE